MLREMIQQNMLIHVPHSTTVMAIHAPNWDGIVAFSCQEAAFRRQLLPHGENLGGEKVYFYSVYPYDIIQNLW